MPANNSQQLPDGWTEETLPQSPQAVRTKPIDVPKNWTEEELPASESSAPTIRMYLPGVDSRQEEDVPVSEIAQRNKNGWYPVLSQQQHEALKADSIEPSTSGNLAIMAAPLFAPEMEATQLVTKPLGAAYDAAADVVEPYASKAVELAGKTARYALPKIAKVSGGIGTIATAAHPSDAIRLAKHYGGDIVGGAYVAGQTAGKIGEELWDAGKQGYNALSKAGSDAYSGFKDWYNANYGDKSQGKK